MATKPKVPKMEERAAELTRLLDRIPGAQTSAELAEQLSLTNAQTLAALLWMERRGTAVRKGVASNGGVTWGRP